MTTRRRLALALLGALMVAALAPLSTQASPLPVYTAGPPKDYSEIKDSYSIFASIATKSAVRLL